MHTGKNTYSKIMKETLYLQDFLSFFCSKAGNYFSCVIANYIWINKITSC